MVNWGRILLGDGLKMGVLILLRKLLNCGFYNVIK